MILKCKMCGGELKFSEGATVCECEFCGRKQTIPALDNEKKMNLFNRANRLRMSAEFDKAASVYTSITAEFPEEAEAYWGLCLCKYGIEYVDDPATGNKVPTCHRTLPESIMEDSDFDQACENADPIAKKLYREEAKAIDRLQRDILDIVEKETPYDVFICYKETDGDGERTEDSVLAQDVYDRLTEKGLKVFFARVTLEDKLGQQYEPYIYAALHSAKVMLAIGTQFEYFDAVWVKNEWARFLDMMKNDRSKTLIPCYKGIDAYDMPREFKNLQAQDMGKLGWLQDLTRGVMKLCGKEESVNTQASTKTVIKQMVEGGNPTVDSLLQRAFMFLEDGDWKSAADYCERVLDIEPVNANAYFGKLLAEMETRNPEELIQKAKIFEKSSNYEKILRFGDESMRERAKSWIEMRDAKVKHDKQSKIFHSAMVKLGAALTAEECMTARKLLESIPDFESAANAIAECDEKRYRIALQDKAGYKWNKAQEAFEALGEYKDSKELAKECKEKSKKEMYKSAFELKARGQWISAIKIFSSLGDYQDSKKQIEECNTELENARLAETKKYEARQKEIEGTRQKVLDIYKTYYDNRIAQAHAKYEEKNRELAALHGLFTGKKRAALQDEIEDFYSQEQRIQRLLKEKGDSIEALQKNFPIEDGEAKKALYDAGSTYLICRLYEEAYSVFAKIRGYKDVDSLIKKDEHLSAAATADREAQIKPYKTIGNIVTFGQYEQDNNAENGKEPIEWIVLGTDGQRSLLISKYALDAKLYHKEYVDITWEKCTLRKWLNDTFLSSAFNEKEQKAIQMTVVDNSDAQGYSGYRTSGGNNTQDKVFLLSYAEAWKYFMSDRHCICQATAYAKGQGADTKSDGSCRWWLRSPSISQDSAALVDDNGSRSGCQVSRRGNAIRPAFWLNLDSLLI